MLSSMFFSLLEVKNLNNLACALFSRTWIDVSGQGPKEVAASLKEQGMFLVGGTNDSTYRKCKFLITTAATLGGMCIGCLTIVADFLGAIGSGTGILLTVNIIYSLYEEIIKNKAIRKEYHLITARPPPVSHDYSYVNVLKYVNLV